MRIIHLRKLNKAFDPQPGSNYDPGWLVRLVRQQHPGIEGYARELGRCTHELHAKEGFIRFNRDLPVIFHRPHGQPGFCLRHPYYGLIVVDLRRDGRVRGIELTGFGGAMGLVMHD